MRISAQREVTEKRRKLHIEAMRIIAVFFVIFNHTELNGFLLFETYNSSTPYFWTYLFISIFCKFSAPLFFMISGALLLKKKEPIGYVWKYRIAKIALVIIIFSIINYAQFIYLGRERFDITRFLKQLYSNIWNTSYWYLYAYIGFLIGLPLLRVLVVNINGRHIYYIMVIVLFFNGFLPMIEYVLFHGGVTLNTTLRPVWMMSNIFCYPLIGYYLENHPEIFGTKKRLLFLWITNVLCIIVSCYMTYFRGNILGHYNNDSQMFHNSFVLVNSVAIYCAIKCLFRKIRIPKMLEKLIASFGGATFGIYLLHLEIMRIPVYAEIWDFLRVQCGINDMLTAFIYCFSVMMTGYFTTLVLKRLPIFRWLL